MLVQYYVAWLIIASRLLPDIELSNQVELVFDLCSICKTVHQIFDNAARQEEYKGLKVRELISGSVLAPSIHSLQAYIFTVHGTNNYAAANTTYSKEPMVQSC